MNSANAEHLPPALKIGVRSLGIAVDENPPAKDFTEARRAFKLIIEKVDPQACDAWLGLAMADFLEHSGEAPSQNTLASTHLIERIYNTRASLGRDQHAIGLAPGTLRGLYDPGVGQYLSLATPGEASLAYATTQVAAGNHDLAERIMIEVKENAANELEKLYADYVLAALYFRTERWDRVQECISAHEWAPGRPLSASVDYMFGTACAYLGQSIEAQRRLENMGDNSHADSYNRAQLLLGYIYRSNGKEEHARSVFESLAAVRVDAALSAEARRALNDPNAKLPVTSEAAIAQRDDIWDPSTTPEIDVTATSPERRAELLKEANEALDRLVGLDSVKEEMQDIVASARVTQAMKDQGIPTGELTEHIILSGPPGTGKTDVARIIAKIFAGLGIVKTDKFVEATEEDLVDKFVGATREKTKKKIDDAMDGCLFVDEVYTLVKDVTEGPNHGREAIEGLLHRMWNDRERLVVIVAGYQEDIEKFLGVNQGLSGRFTNRINFHSYDPDELLEIADVIAGTSSPLTEAAKARFREVCTRAYNTKAEDGRRRQIDVLGNGRFVYRAIGAAAKARNRRLINDKVDLEQIKEHLAVLPEDIDRGVAKILKEPAESDTAAT